MRCPSCEADVQAGARFCPQCAAPMPAADSAPADPLRAALEAAIGFQYKIVRLLGRGGMGAVYLAHELALDREVAIKVLPPGRGEPVESRERFRREARTAARLNHSHVVPLYTFGEVHGIVYYVMGYVKGEPLAARLRREGRLAVEETRRILGELADALDYAHRQGVVHRDLKPDNVLLEEDSGRALLADFGIAKAAGAGHTLTATGTIVGTPLYMSPEQASGRGDVDGRSDLYSLGVIGYEMLAGRRPFDAPTPADVLVQHMTKEPPALAPLAGGAPEPLVKAVTRCLAKDPAARWPDARTLRQALLPSDEDVELPRALFPMSVIAQVSLFALLAVVYFRLYDWASGETDNAGFGDAFARITPVAIVLFLAANAFLAWRAGHSWREVLRAALIQPRWWVGWYPRRFRSPADVWDRLPADIRRARQLTLSLVVYVAMLVIPTILVNSAVDRTYEQTGTSPPLRAAAKKAARPLTEVHAFVLLALTVVLAALTLRVKHRLRNGAGAALDDYDAQRLFAAATGNRRFWGRPAVAAVLSPATGRSASGTEPTSADEIERALKTLPERVLASERELARRARDAAAQARHSLAALDEELRLLERDYDAAEAKRLEDRLAASGDARPDEPPERRQMRELLGKQAQLLRGFASRIEHGRRERARRLGQMRALWREADVLRSPDAARSPEVVARLQTLCAELERGPSSDVATLSQSAVADAETLPR